MEAKQAIKRKRSLQLEGDLLPERPVDPNRDAIYEFLMIMIDIWGVCRGCARNDIDADLFNDGVDVGSSGHYRESCFP